MDQITMLAGVIIHNIIYIRTCAPVVRIYLVSSASQVNLQLGAEMRLRYALACKYCARPCILDEQVAMHFHYSGKV